MKNRTTLFLFLLFLAPATLAQAGTHVFPTGKPPVLAVFEPPKPLEYVVQKGDTLAGIAKKNGLDLSALSKANGNLDPKKLKLGQKLVIPGKTAPAAAQAVAAPAAQAGAQAAKAPADAGKPAQGATVAPAAPAAKAEPAKPAEKAEPAKPAEKPMTAAEIKAEEKKAKEEAKKAQARLKADKPGAEDPGVVKSAPGAPAVELALTGPRHGAAKTGVISNDTDVPEAIRKEFLEYAKKWMDMSEDLAVGTEKNKKIRQAGGKWECSYRKVQKDTLGAEVKRVYYDHTPYVGHLTYRVITYTCEAPTKEGAIKGPFAAKEEAIREIFSYSGKNKAWR